MDNIWVEITINTTTEAVEAVTNILFENGAQGAMIEDPKDFDFQKAHEYDWDYVEEDIFKRHGEDDSVYIKTYISEEKNIAEFVETIRTRIFELKKFDIDIGTVDIFTNDVREDDWTNNWKKYYKPRKIGENIVIKPEWEEYDAKNGDIIIEMNPGMAFGTGDHETTNMCISNLEKIVKKENIVYDIGCGSGILGITAAKLGASKVVGIDIDEVAVKVANENIEKNNVSTVMTALVGNLADEINEDDKADVIVANIIADIVIVLAEDTRKFLKKDGIFISSGIILSKIDDVVKAFKDNKFEIVDIQTKGEWACILAR